MYKARSVCIYIKLFCKDMMLLHIELGKIIICSDIWIFLLIRETDNGNSAFLYTYENNNHTTLTLTMWMLCLYYVLCEKKTE